ncbi:MAG TPA: adenylate/guanylate cyclase domain-containing protein, partial [bacterium]|nr:adenylate/guanylate cyclase domain-containing protein [bacterium]
KLAPAKPRAVVVDYLYRYQSSLASLGHTLKDVLAKKDVASSLSAEDRAQVDSILAELTSADRYAEALPLVQSYLPANCITGGNIPWESEEAERLDLERIRLGWAFPAPPDSIHTDYPDIRFQYPNAAFLKAATGVVQSCEYKDPGNVLRRDLPVISVKRLGQEYLVPNATVVVAALAMGLKPGDLSATREGLLLGKHLVPTDADGRTPFVLYRGVHDFRDRAHQRQPNTFSAREIIERGANPKYFEDKVVLIGETHDASTDRKVTPLANSKLGVSGTPGVELIALQADAMTRDPFPLLIPRWLDTWWGSLLGLAALALGILIGQWVDPRRPASIAAGAAAVLLIPVTGIILFAFEGIWLRPLFPTGSALVAASVGILDGYLFSRRQQQLTKDSFAKMVSPEVVEAIIASGHTPEMGGEDRELTLLFADLRGFTSKSEQMSAQSMVDLLNGHLDEMAGIIRRHGGTVDKFIGDCVMAFWGAPIPDADHALHACQAGIEMLAAVERSNERRRAAGQVELAIGVGINTGRVVVGMMGSQGKLEYTAIGDAVNLASRFEGMTKDAGYGALIGESTAKALDGRIPVDPLGGLKVKGKAAPVPIYGITATRKAAPATTAASS